jgi:hypothetical protein
MEDVMRREQLRCKMEANIKRNIKEMGLVDSELGPS